MEFVDNVEKANAILIGFPIDQGTENIGCKDAPSAIRKGFDNLYFPMIAKQVKVKDMSDVIEAESFEKTMEKIKQKILEISKFKKPIFSIGGNHSITVPIIQALAQTEKFAVVFIDAHPDCQKSYFPYGNVVPKIIELDIPVVILGIRNWSKDEYNYLQEKNIPYILASDYSLEKAQKLLEQFKGKKVYVSLDIDAIDPAFAPGTGCIEPAGLSSVQTLKLLHNMGKNLKIIGMDLVEINPKKDINNMTSILGAKLLFETMNSLV